MKLYDINLLPKRKNNAADILLTFILYYFRYIIVITQIIVIGVFFFRFRVDQQVIDLKESFKQKQQILAVTIPIVEEAKVIERKSKDIRLIVDQQDQTLDTLAFILKSVPREITIKNIQLLDNETIISGTSTQVFAIRAYHKKLTTHAGFELAEILSIERQLDGSFEFIIRKDTISNEKE